MVLIVSKNMLRLVGEVLVYFVKIGAAGFVSMLSELDPLDA